MVKNSGLPNEEMFAATAAIGEAAGLRMFFCTPSQQSRVNSSSELFAACKVDAPAEESPQLAWELQAV